ncbi:hypothetical protein 4 [Beihai tombus-like virus 10]|uniref:hypothetical protein 4 n=1 Tax=Beihai tombus-like virus 10 TaxID=1922713 RepID=UPI00090BC311|nr:hypothetical protein 4 [Beihai tombus-like virus 10]APG76199.1 hypothetical protein 4 [Beihai tombus-like virus 10]
MKTVTINTKWTADSPDSWLLNKPYRIDYTEKIHSVTVPALEPEISIDNVTTAEYMVGDSSTNTMWPDGPERDKIYVRHSFLGSINATQWLKTATIVACYSLSVKYKILQNGEPNRNGAGVFGRDLQLFRHDLTVMATSPKGITTAVVCPLVANTVVNVLDDRVLQSLEFKTTFVVVAGWTYTFVMHSYMRPFFVNYKVEAGTFIVFSAVATGAFMTYIYPGEHQVSLT